MLFTEAKSALVHKSQKIFSLVRLGYISKCKVIFFSVFSIKVLNVVRREEICYKNVNYKTIV